MRMTETELETEVLKVANYYIKHISTVRKTGKALCIPKSRVHKYLVVYLPKISPSLSKDARKILDKNTAERHIRGGIATQKKFRNLSN